MKRIIFSALWLLIITATSCNNNDKTKETEKNSIVAGLPGPGAKEPGKMVDTLMQEYPIFTGSIMKDSLVEYVKFNYIDFMDSTTTNKATDVYLIYGALTNGDTARYLATHAVDPKDRNILSNRPCLLVGFKDAGNFTYRDFGSLCPPPNSCATHFMLPEKITFPAIPPLVPDATMKNYFFTYNKLPGNPLTTTMVKFNVALLKHYVDSLNAEKPAGTAKDIYFKMAAYTDSAAQKYVDDNSGTTKAQIIGKTGLLFVYKRDPTAKEVYLDFGKLCPPDN